MQAVGNLTDACSILHSVPLSLVVLHLLQPVRCCRYWTRALLPRPGLPLNRNFSGGRSFVRHGVIFAPFNLPGDEPRPCEITGLAADDASLTKSSTDLGMNWPAQRAMSSWLFMKGCSFVWRAAALNHRAVVGTLNLGDITGLPASPRDTPGGGFIRASQLEHFTGAFGWHVITVQFVGDAGITPPLLLPPVGHAEYPLHLRDCPRACAP